MVLNKDSYGYTEEYDMEALTELAQMAIRDVVACKYGEFLKANGARVPGEDYSDFSCNVWSLMKSLVEYGIRVEQMAKEVGNADINDIDMEYFKLRHPPLIGAIDVMKRE